MIRLWSFVIVLLISGAVGAAPAEDTQMLYSGRLFDESGQPYGDQDLQVRLEIMGGAGCYLYRRSEAVRTDPDGHFSILLSEHGKNEAANFIVASSVQAVLSSTRTGTITCRDASGGLGSSFTPSNTRKRKIVVSVSVNDLPYAEADSQEVEPYFQAVDSEKLGGRAAENFVALGTTGSATHILAYDPLLKEAFPVTCTDDQILKWSAVTGWTCATEAGGGGAGTVTSVGLSAPTSVFSVTGSGGIGAVNLGLSFLAQNAATVFAAPTGSTGLPGFRPLAASDIANGTFGMAQIPDLDAAKIATGTFASARIPDFDVSKITTGTLDLARIPDLDAAKMTSGILSPARMPDFSAMKITSGTLPVSRGGTGLVPTVSDANRVYGVNSAGDHAEFKTLVGGSGVTITDSTGALTFSFDSSAIGAGITDVTGDGNILVAASGTTRGLSLGTTGVAEGTYGTIAQVPMISVDKWGRLTSVNMQPIPSATTGGGFGLITVDASSGLTLNSGTLGLNLSGLSGANFGPQAQNMVLAGPLSGGTGAVAFRPLSPSDIPNLDAAKITSGTLPVSRGGTGLAPQVSDANRLYGINAAGSNSEFKALTAGNGITISNTANSISISAPGAGTLGWAQGGNSFGQTGTLGTNDSQALVFETDNATRMTITSDGNVGIGTIAPSGKLHVEGGAMIAGPIIVAGSAGSGRLSLQEWPGNGSNAVSLRAPAALAADYTLTLPAATGANGQILSTDASGNLSWTSMNGGDFRADGTVAMTGTFRAADGLAASPSITFSDETGTGLFRIGNGTLGLGIAVNSVEWVRFTSDKVTLHGHLDLDSGKTIKYGGQNFIHHNNDFSSNQSLFIGYFSGPSFATGIANTALGTYAGMSLSGGADQNTFIGSRSGLSLTTGDGNIFIGSGAGSGITTGSNNIHIGYKASSPAGMESELRIGTLLKGSLASTLADRYLLIDGKLGVGTAAPPDESIETAGNVKAIAFISTSDERLKMDIHPAPGLSAIRQLAGKQYRWRSNGDGDAGVIAQELERVFPDAVRTDSRGYKAVKYNYLLAPLIEAVKELDVRCEAGREDLERRIDELESRNRVLEDKNRHLEERLLRLERAAGFAE